jgi:ADP-heptose:LPS heptosyltransferase
MHNEKILVLAEGQLGDLLLLTPAVRALRNGHPDARITVLIFHRHRSSAAESAGILVPADGTGTSAVMTSHPCVDEVFEVDRMHLRSLRGVARAAGEISLVKALRARDFDTVICTFPEDRFAALAYFTGARVRVGQKRQKLSRLLNVTPAIEKQEMGVLAYYCALAEAAGGRVEGMRTEFQVSPEADRAAAVLLLEKGIQDERWIAVHPGASGEYKIWPPERFASLIEGLERNRIPVLLFGGTADAEILDAVQKKLPGSVAVIRTGNDVGVFAALLRRAALCITNDSGPRHLAVAVGTASLALFRQFHGNEWKIYPESGKCVAMTGTQPCSACPPSVCLDRTPAGERYGAVCLRQLGVEEVLVRALEMVISA